MLKIERKPQPWPFLFGTLIWTWTFFILAGCTGQGWLQFPTIILTALGALGPMITGVVLISMGCWDTNLDRSARAFLKRSFNPRTLSLRWFFLIILFILVLSLIPLLLQPSVIAREGLFKGGTLLFIIIGFFIGALEEVGWRGYGQEALQRQLPVLLAALVIGVFWALWHLPLFFLAGSYQASLGIGTPAFWGFNGAIVLGSPLYAWFYNASGRVVLVPLLFHGLGNLAGELFTDSPPGLEIIVKALVVLVVISLSWGWMKIKLPGPGPF
ncbi:MAG: CPBP family intramembrane metalloprotease [Candidatus Syntrophonatronum acetioxidans]|uniref:CPBP family intramembrane metalloprotease n=1 Tax=Candidatus Syntrophonatronum acetioxidans TaxID=1795816 RepID=A0A424YIA9_9FIRM|nr:MAG: CPBP family intramembrane metalloprotease [Candidatus Syntrophonatronum acetioxidans]